MPKSISIPVLPKAADNENKYYLYCIHMVCVHVRACVCMCVHVCVRTLKVIALLYLPRAGPQYTELFCPQLI